MDFTETARIHLAQHGLPPVIADMVEAWTSPAPGDAPDRANVSVGYEDAGRRRETAMVSLPDLDAALAMLADRDRVGAVLSLGIQAVPRAHRPDAPDWVVRSDEARRTRRALSRAQGLAEARAAGIARDDATTLAETLTGDAPF